MAPREGGSRIGMIDADAATYAAVGRRPRHRHRQHRSPCSRRRRSSLPARRCRRGGAHRTAPRRRGKSYTPASLAEWPRSSSTSGGRELGARRGSDDVARSLRRAVEQGDRIRPRDDRGQLAPALREPGRKRRVREGNRFAVSSSARKPRPLRASPRLGSGASCEVLVSQGPKKSKAKRATRPD